MKQLIQNFKTGELKVMEVPLPNLQDEMILVENSYSLISAGTEKNTVKTGKASLAGKAKQRPDLVKQVLTNLQKEGLKATYEKVKTKLDSLKALGYSSAGIVKASMDSDGIIKPGDRVACGGGDYAVHAEIVNVPKNLVVKIPENVSMAEASFTTLGAIALQGVRQASPNIGEKVCVIGLGLLGQITCQILRGNGCEVFGIDISKDMVDLAQDLSADHAMVRDDGNLKAAIEDFTNGYGFDSIIITAAAPTNDPVELSVEIARQKGKIVVVGAVGMNIPRNPHFYRKELDFTISCSYGPGRYDRNYEENGQDYPFGYVRWTEKRNMEAFISLVSRGVIRLKPLITHIFEIDKADEAYDIILGKKKERFIGILLKYPENDKKEITLFENKKVIGKKKSRINIGFIGAGSFAQNHLIPNLKRLDVDLNTVVTSRGISASNVSTKFGFRKFSTNSDDILKDDNIDLIFIATRHNTHASYVIEAIKNGKNVFVEKPLALNYDELFEIIHLYEKSENIRILTGFNRRFSSLARFGKGEFRKNREPLSMNFIINGGHIPKEHWIQDPVEGGGRIIGEVCHFVDLMQFFTDSLPVKVYAASIESNNSEIKNEDNISILINFADGSLGTIIYLANGDKSMPKEKIEISSGGRSFLINDFKSGTLYSDNSFKNIKLSGKGHREEVTQFIENIRMGKQSPIEFKSICYTTITTFKIVDSLRTGLPQEIIV